MENLKFVKGTYLAFKISEKSRIELLSVWRPKFSKVICEHVTIEFNLTEDKLEQYKTMFSDSINIVRDATVYAIGYAEGDGVECIAIEINGDQSRMDGSFYHVTLSIEPPHKPIESNTLKNKVSKISARIAIEGSFKLLRK